MSDEWDTLLKEISSETLKHTDIIEFKEFNENCLTDNTKPKNIKIEDDYKVCPNCKIYFKIMENSLVCEKCGIEREWQDTNTSYNCSLGMNYNISQNSYVSFNVIGNGAYCYQRSFLKTCSNYNLFRNNNNKKELNNIIFQYEGNKPPVNTVNLASELFDKIARAGYVYRKNCKRGVMAACLYYSCIINNVARTPKDIANIMGTQDKFLSLGDKILQELNELKVISIPIHYTPLNDYINQYFSLLGIPDKYKKFVIDIIERAEKKHLHIKNDCRITTKCIGVIYLLTQRVKELKYIKKDFIAKECNNISKSTFIKYYNLLCDNHILIKKSFKRHGIPMPKSWKN